MTISYCKGFKDHVRSQYFLQTLTIIKFQFREMNRAEFIRYTSKKKTYNNRLRYK